MKSSYKYCAICNLNTLTPEEWENHIKSSKHKTKTKNYFETSPTERRKIQENHNKEFYEWVNNQNEVSTNKSK